MKRLKYAVILLLGLNMVTMMTSCNKEDSYKDKIVGKWKVVKDIGGLGDFDNAIFEFKSDGYFAFYEYSDYDDTYCAHEGTYSVNENNIEIIMRQGDEALAGTIQEISNDKLTLVLRGFLHLEFVRTNETINFHL